MSRLEFSWLWRVYPLKKSFNFWEANFPYNNYQYVILSCTTDTYAIILSDYSVVPIYLIHYGLYWYSPSEREREREYWTKIRQVISPGQRLNTLVNPWGRPGSQVMVSLPLGLAVDHVHEVLRQTWAKIDIEPSNMMKQTD